MARARFLWSIAFCVSTVAAAELAPPSTYEGKTIVALRYEPPSQPVTRADLARLVPFEPGMPLHLDDVRFAIKRLYATGEYSNIAVETESDPNGVVLVFRTTEQWFIGPVSVEGKIKMPPNEGQLANASRLEFGAPFDDETLQSATRGIRDLLQRNGLYLSKIDPKTSRDPEHQQIAFTFRVDAGKRARFTTPEITGDTKLPAEDVAKAAKLKGWFRWKSATEQNTQRGLRNIREKYNKKDRLTASVTLDHTDYLPDENRVRPTIQADGGPKVKVEASGAKVSKGKMEKYVPVFDEETVNRDLLVRGARNLRDYFQNSGYFDAQVDFKTATSNNDQETITYLVTPGERHKVVNIEIKGNRYFKTSAISERIFLHTAGFIRLRHGRYSEGFLKRDQDAIQALYRDNGFRDCKVNIDIQDDYKGKAGDVAITINIDEGAQYTVANLEVNGITRPDRDDIISLLSCAPGQPFSETSVAIDRDYLLTIFQSSGYPEVTFAHQVLPGDGEHQMKVVYNVIQGQPRFVRDVLLTGMHNTSRRLVDPNILLKAGDPLSWTEMGRMQRRLYNLGVFDKVDMAIQNPTGDTQNKYVLYNLNEGHRYYVAVGLGAEIARIGGSQSSLENSQGATGFAPRGNLEVSRLNMWGFGHSLNFKGRYSTLDRRLSLNYLAPRYRNIDGRNISVTALYDNTRDVLTFNARRLEGAAQFSQRLSKPTTVLWRYSWRNVKVDENTLKIDPLLIPLLSQPSRIAMIGANLIQDRRDDPANAHRGVYNSIDTGLAEHVFGGNKNFFRFLARNSYYKPLSGEWILASNTEFGWIRPFRADPTLSAFDYVPLAEHFFGGGSTSHRGFSDNQAGPRDLLTGFPLGGNALLFHSTELRFPFLGENINGVFFHDFGNIYRDLGSITFRVHQRDVQDFNYMVHAAGFGIRYNTPVGPVRVDLAYSFNPPTFFGLKGTYQELIQGTATPQLQRGKHFQFFISIGQAF